MKNIAQVKLLRIFLSRLSKMTAGERELLVVVTRYGTPEVGEKLFLKGLNLPAEFSTEPPAPVQQELDL